MSILAIPPDFSFSDEFQLQYNFIPGTPPEDRVRLLRTRDRETIPVKIDECAEPPTREQINGYFPSPLSQDEATPDL